ncbi:Gustatory receptor for sugar taste 64f [Lucilia cuprina]|nr:Gustatory receptor for sugar taste 64f [Lucilia cuprina]
MFSLYFRIKSANMTQNQLKHKLLRRGTKKDYTYTGSFQEAIRPAQIFAIMPLAGVTSSSSYDLKFSWRFIRTWYSVLVILCFGFFMGVTIAYAFRGIFNFDSVEGIIFYSSIFFIALTFFDMTRKWPMLMQEWQQVEQALPQQRTIMERSWLPHKIKMITLVATMCSLGEHTLSILNIVYYVNRCPTFKHHPIDSFLYTNFSQYFFFFDYNTLAGVLGKVVNLLSTFAWNFNDIFLMCVCVALSSKFRQLNVYMASFLKKPTTAEFWMERRKNYRMLCRLSESVDNTIALITMLCLSNNLYFICNKILKSIQKKPSFTHTLYFWYSLIFLLGRTFILALYAAEINEESRKPLVIFRKVKREFWCPELKRFSEEVNADLIALTGLKLFSLTRSMVLSVAGTILTYELVLLQYNKNSVIKIFRKATKDTFIYEGGFSEAVGKTEFFAIMPVKGITNSQPRYFTFSWSNYRTWYSLIFIFIMIFDTSLAMNKILNGAITFNNIEPLIFRICIITFIVCSLSLARKWPDLMVYWYEIEQKLPPYNSQFQKSRMAYKIRMVTLVGMMLSLTEHLLSCISVIHYSNFCPITNDPIENFFRLSNEHIFKIFPYSNWWGWYGKISNFISTFTWNYMDIFVMIISIGLASKFQQLNENLMQYKNKQMSPAFWSENRILYRNLCSLCERMDDAISMITMVSFSNNLYFICVQLLRSLNKMPSIAHAAYFYFSLFFLLGRTLAVSLYSSTVHDESRKPLLILRCVPKESWCLEVKRFAEEISNDLIALSGMKFFHLTRKLVLSVAGTIVTYELVLIQFHEDTNLWDCENNRNQQFDYQSEMIKQLNGT